MPTETAVATHWLWDLETGRVDWDARLEALFGYTQRVTDPAWREGRIHPEDRERIKLALQRATIVNDGTPTAETFRFLQADGSYATVTERTRLVSDTDGPRRVQGTIALA